MGTKRYSLRPEVLDRFGTLLSALAKPAAREPSREEEVTEMFDQQLVKDRQVSLLKDAEQIHLARQRPPKEPLVRLRSPSSFSSEGEVGNRRPLTWRDGDDVMLELVVRRGQLERLKCLEA